MKKFIWMILFIPFTCAYGQSVWEPMFLTVSGNNVVDGVEGWFQAGECQGADVVLLRFVNTNPTPVMISWNDGVFTQTLQWEKKSGTEYMKSIEIPGQTEQAGTCGELAELIFPLADFKLVAADFKRYTAQDLTVTIK